MITSVTFSLLRLFDQHFDELARLYERLGADPVLGRIQYLCPCARYFPDLFSQTLSKPIVLRSMTLARFRMSKVASTGEL